VTIKGKRKEKYEPTRSRDEKLMVVSMTNIGTKTTLHPAIKCDKDSISAPLDSIYNDSEKQQTPKLHESLHAVPHTYHFLHL
jgi:hypothetical protein